MREFLGSSKIPAFVQFTQVFVERDQYILNEVDIAGFRASQDVKLPLGHFEYDTSVRWLGIAFRDELKVLDSRF